MNNSDELIKSYAYRIKENWGNIEKILEEEEEFIRIVSEILKHEVLRIREKGIKQKFSSLTEDLNKFIEGLRYIMLINPKHKAIKHK